MIKDSLLRYHPERYRRTRPFSKKVASAYQSTAGINPPTSESLEAISNIIMNTYNDEISLIPRESRPTEIRLLMREPSMASYYGAYCAYGRNIFHLNDEILEEFLYTDIKTVPIGFVDFPYDCFYISFGSIKELTLHHDNCYVDGAYIFAFSGFPLQIALTTLSSTWNYSSRYEWIFNPDRYYYMTIERDDPSATFGILINNALKNEIEAHQNNEETFRTGIYELEDRSVSLINKCPENTKKNQKEISFGFDTFCVALNLIVNAICYISQYKSEIEESWPEDTPQSLLSKLKNTKTPKQTQRIVSKLISMGYTKLKVCGNSFKKQNLQDDGNQIRSHWRRGHWRQQPYGEALKERKMTWIRPTIVGRDKNSLNSGHIYELSKKS